MPKQNCKKKYPSRLEAEIAMARIHERAAKNRHKSKDKLPIRSYHCPLCGRHHLTSEPLRKKE